jgi:hypothetical protein
MTLSELKDVVVKSCDRTMDMTTQLVKLQHKKVIENQGKGAVIAFCKGSMTCWVKRFIFFFSEIQSSLII